ncbi:MAG: DNRLRE domain-containing protein [Acidobacteriota bacterium]|nr:DNRLRE domain-containing protein [Acidobacteriota bacterium]
MSYFRAVVLCFLLLCTAPLAAEPAPALAGDNLITNPWFRSAGDPTDAGLDGWSQPQNIWGTSQKLSNPTPDGVTGTAARFAAGSGDGQDHSGEDAYLSTVVVSDPALRTLRFQTWVVSLFLEEATVTVYGGSGAQGPWTQVWQPWATTTSGNGVWEQLPLVETEIATGYPYYRIELHGRYQAGRNQGVKYTGVYFATSASGTSPEPPNPPSNLQATALSTSQIQLTWTDASTDETGFEIQRSADQGASYQNLVALGAGAETYVDGGLAAATEYRYRVRAVGSGGASPWAGPVTASTLSGGGGGGGGETSSFPPAADAYVYSARPTNNYGAETVLRARTGQYRSFLAFEIDPGTVESAVLRVTSNAPTSVPTAVSLTEPAAAAWNETSITWNNQPALGATLGTLPSSAPSDVLELDVTTAAATAALGSGRFTVALTGTGSGQSFFLSRESTVGPPELVVTYAGGTEPPPVADLPHLEIGPSPALLLDAGDVVQLTASWYDADGNPTPLPPGAQVVWTSSNPERVSVDANGLATVITDDTFTLIAAAADGADLHVPAVASIATGAVMMPGIVDLDASLLLDLAVDPAASVDLGYLTLTVQRTAQTEVLGAGDLATFGTAASIAVQSVEVQTDSVILRGNSPPFEAVYEHLNIDLDASALERIADVYADAGFPSWDGSPVDVTPAVGASAITPKALSDCDFSINPSFSPSSQFKLQLDNGAIVAMAIGFEGLMGIGVPEVRWQTQVECAFEVLPRLWLFPIPLHAVATFHFYAYIKPGVEIGLDLGQSDGGVEVGSPTFEYSTLLYGGLEWDDVDGLRLPSGFEDPELTGSGTTPYVSGPQTADMTLSARSYVELGVKASLYPGVFPSDPTGAFDTAVILDIFFLANQFATQGEIFIPGEAFLGPADPEYLGPTMTDAALWDFFPFKSIETGTFTERVLEIFGWDLVDGAAFEVDPITITELSVTAAGPELEAVHDPVWINGAIPHHWPSTDLESRWTPSLFQDLWRPIQNFEIWARPPGAPEFSLLGAGNSVNFSPLEGQEGVWEFRSFDSILPFFPSASAVETVTVKEAPPVLVTPVDPEIVGTLGDVWVLDLYAYNIGASAKTYTLSNDTGPSWLTVEPDEEITIAPGVIIPHLLRVDCTGTEPIPPTWIELTLDVDGELETFPYPVFAGCENFSVEPEVVVLKGTVADPPVVVEGELTIHNRTDQELPWTSSPTTDLPFSLAPAGGFVAAESDELVTVSAACTVGGVTESEIEISVPGDQRTITLRLECADSGGNSWGDPHLVTHDGVHYDFQAHGEMVLSRAPNAGFEVQVRQAGGSGGRVSYNKAAALLVGTDRVGFYVNPPGGGGPLMVNGEAVALADGETYDLPGGGSVSRTSSTYTVLWPSIGPGASSYVRVKRSGSSVTYFNVRVHPAAALAGTLVGLLGNYDGHGTNDFVLRDGTPLPSPPSFDQLYDCSVTDCFAYDDPRGWIIRDSAESLFDYDIGLGPLDYAPENGSMYPLVETSLDDFDPALVAWAQSQCVAAGITDPMLLQACILDIVVSGDVEMGLEAGEVGTGTETEPSTEVCDGFDNDLDGLIDNGGVCICLDGTAGGRDYRFCGATVPWAVARTACLAQGLDLAKIQDAAENQAVALWIRNNSSQARWIGLTDEGQEGNWIWTDGTPAGFFNWGFMQPSGGTTENCVEHAEHPIDGDSWNDLPCDALRGFICE